MAEATENAEREQKERIADRLTRGTQTKGTTSDISTDPMSTL